MLDASDSLDFILQCNLNTCKAPQRRRDLLVTCGESHLVCASHIIAWDHKSHAPCFEPAEDLYQNLCSRTRKENAKRYLRTVALIRCRKWKEAKTSLEKLAILKKCDEEKDIRCLACHESGKMSHFPIKSIHDQIYGAPVSKISRMFRFSLSSQESNPTTDISKIVGAHRRSTSVTLKMKSNRPSDPTSRVETDLMQMVQHPIHSAMLVRGFTSEQIQAAVGQLGQNEAEGMRPDDLAELIATTFPTKSSHENEKRRVKSKSLTEPALEEIAARASTSRSRSWRLTKEEVSNLVDVPHTDGTKRVGGAGSTEELPYLPANISTADEDIACLSAEEGQGQYRLLEKELEGKLAMKGEDGNDDEVREFSDAGDADVFPDEVEAASNRWSILSEVGSLGFGSPTVLSPSASSFGLSKVPEVVGDAEEPPRQMQYEDVSEPTGFETGGDTSAKFDDVTHLEYSSGPVIVHPGAEAETALTEASIPRAAEKVPPSELRTTSPAVLKEAVEALAPDDRFMMEKRMSIHDLRESRIVTRNRNRYESGDWGVSAGATSPSPSPGSGPGAISLSPAAVALGGAFLETSESKDVQVRPATASRFNKEELEAAKLVSTQKGLFQKTIEG